jgi:hypothetical protein
VASLILVVGLAATSAAATLPQPPIVSGSPSAAAAARSWVERIFGGAASGAQTAATAVLGYTRDRFLDLVDIFELDLGVGPGLKAGVEYGVGRTTLGYVEAQRFGLDGRQVGTWSERNVAYGIFPASLAFAPFELVRGAGEVWEGLAVVGFEMGSLGVERTKRESFATTATLYGEASMVGPWHERPGDLCAVGAEAHLLILGARARVKPLEIVDFIVGIVGVDLDPKLAHPQAGRVQ